jgi:hypothetical protein
MARQFYSPKTRTAILDAVRQARAQKKSWKDAHTAAKAAGYKGGLPAIIKMVRMESGKGPGRPKGAGRRPGRPPGRSASVNGVGSINAIVDKIVKDRVRIAIQRAIAVLEKSI